MSFWGRLFGGGRKPAKNETLVGAWLDELGGETDDERWQRHSDMLAERFGTKPRDPDVQWSIWAEDQGRFIQFGFWRELEMLWLKRADLLSKEQRHKQAVAAFLTAFLHQQCGPKLPPAGAPVSWPFQAASFDPDKAGPVPAGMAERATKQVELAGLSRDDLRELFYSEVGAHYLPCFPLSLDELWNRISARL